MAGRPRRFNLRKLVFTSTSETDSAFSKTPPIKASLTLRPDAEFRLEPGEPELSIRQRPQTVESALDYLETRILARRTGDFDQLLYLASFRDLASGAYLHNSLAADFGADLATEAMRQAHRRVFHRVLQAPFAVLIEEFETYLGSLPAPAESVIELWKNLRVCRTLIPNDAERCEVSLFESLMDVVLGASEAGPSGAET